MRFPLALLLAAASMGGGAVESAPVRTSTPRGPGYAPLSWSNPPRPLPKPASQAKRRRRARRVRGGGA